MAGRKVLQKFANKFGEQAAKAYLYGDANSTDAKLVKNTLGAESYITTLDKYEKDIPEIVPPGGRDGVSSKAKTALEVFEAVENQLSRAEMDVYKSLSGKDKKDYQKEWRSTGVGQGLLTRAMHKPDADWKPSVKSGVTFFPEEAGDRNAVKKRFMLLAKYKSRVNS